MHRSSTVALALAGAFLLSACARPGTLPVTNVPAVPVLTSAQVRAIEQRVEKYARAACRFAPDAETVANVVIDVVARYRNVGNAAAVSALVDQSVDSICQPVLASDARLGTWHHVLRTRHGIAVHGRFVRTGRRV